MEKRRNLLKARGVLPKSPSIDQKKVSPSMENGGTFQRKLKPRTLKERVNSLQKQTPPPPQKTLEVIPEKSDNLPPSHRESSNPSSTVNTNNTSSINNSNNNNNNNNSKNLKKSKVSLMTSTTGTSGSNSRNDSVKLTKEDISKMSKYAHMKSKYEPTQNANAISTIKGTEYHNNIKSYFEKSQINNNAGKINKLANRSNFNDPFAKTFANCSSTYNKKYDNSNIYKNDKSYKMNKYLRLESNAIENRSNNQFEKGTKIIFLFIEFIEFYQLCVTYKYNKQIIGSSFINYVYIPVMILLMLISIIVFSKKNTDYLLSREIKRLLSKVLLCSCQIIYIYLFIRYSKETQQTIIYVHIILLIINLLFDSSFAYTIFLSMIDLFVIFLGYYKKYDSFNIYNFYEFIFHIVSAMAIGVLDYLMRRARRQMWILLDSFKSSYHYLNNSLISCINMPIFIISKSKNILYCNDEGHNFCKIMLNVKNLSGNDLDSECKEFKNLLIDESVFDYYLLKTLSNEHSTYFFYPFIPKNNKDKDITKIIKNISMLIYTDISGLKWYQIIVSPCYWKNNESFYMQLFPYDDMQFHDFISDKLHNLSQNLATLIDELDNTCLEYKNKNSYYLESKRQKNLQKEQQQKNNNNINNSEIINPINFIENKINQMVVNQHQIINYSYFDYSMWFYLAMKTKSLYSIFSTLQIFGMYFLHHIYNDYQNIKLDEFLSSISELFYLKAQTTGFSLEYSRKGENHVRLNIQFLSCIIVNLISFILHNHKETSNKEKEKKLNFMVEVIKKKEYFDSINARKNALNEEKRTFKNHSVLERISTNLLNNESSKSNKLKIDKNANSSFNDNILITDDDLVIKVSIDYPESLFIYELMTANGKFYEEVHGTIDKEMEKLNYIPFGIYCANYIVSLIYYNKIDYDPQYQQIYFYALAKSINKYYNEKFKENNNNNNNFKILPRHKISSNAINIKTSLSTVNLKDENILEDKNTSSKNMNYNNNIHNENNNKANTEGNVENIEYNNKDNNNNDEKTNNGGNVTNNECNNNNNNAKDRNILHIDYGSNNINNNLNTSGDINANKNDNSKNKIEFYNFYIKKNYDTNKIYYNRILQLLYNINIDDKILIFNSEIDNNFDLDKDYPFNESKDVNKQDSNILDKSTRHRKLNLMLNECDQLKKHSRALSNIGGTILTKPEDKLLQQHILNKSHLKSTKEINVYPNKVEDQAIFDKSIEKLKMQKKYKKEKNKSSTTLGKILKNFEELFEAIKKEDNDQKENVPASYRQSFNLEMNNDNGKNWYDTKQKSQSNFTVSLLKNKNAMNKKYIDNNNNGNKNKEYTHKFKSDSSFSKKQKENIKNDENLNNNNSINIINNDNKLDDEIKINNNKSIALINNLNINKLDNETKISKNNNDAISHNLNTNKNNDNNNDNTICNSSRTNNNKYINNDIDMINKRRSSVRSVFNENKAFRNIEATAIDDDIILKKAHSNYLNRNKKSNTNQISNFPENNNKNNNNTSTGNENDIKDKKTSEDINKINLATQAVNDKNDLNNMNNVNNVNNNDNNLPNNGIINNFNKFPKYDINNNLNKKYSIYDENLDVDIKLYETIQKQLDNYNKSKTYYIQKNNSFNNKINTEYNSNSQIKFKEKNTNINSNNIQQQKCIFSNDNETLGYNQKILFMQDSKFFETMSPNFYILKNTENIEQLKYDVDYLSGGSNELKKRIDINKNKGLTYNLIIIETYRPEEYENNEYLVKMKDRQHYNTLFIKVIKNSNDNSSGLSSSTINNTFENKLFNDFIYKTNFQNKIKDTLDKIKINDENNTMTYI